MSEPYFPGSESRLFPVPARTVATGSSLPVSLCLPPPEAAATVSGSAQQDKIKQTQAQLEEVKGILGENIVRIQERGERLDDLQHRSDTLTIQAQNLKSSTGQLRRRMWYKNAKWTILVAILVIIVVAVVVGGSIKAAKS